MSFGLIPTSASVPFPASEASSESCDVLSLLETDGPSADGFAALLCRLSGAEFTPAASGILPDDGENQTFPVSSTEEAPVLVPTDDDTDVADLPPELMLVTFAGLNVMMSPAAGTDSAVTTTETLPETAADLLPAVDGAGRTHPVEQSFGITSSNEVETVPQTDTTLRTSPGTSHSQTPVTGHESSTLSGELAAETRTAGPNRSDSQAPIDASLSQQPSLEDEIETPVTSQAVAEPIPEPSTRSVSLPAADVERPDVAADPATLPSQSMGIVEDRAANRLVPDDLPAPTDSQPITPEHVAADSAVEAATPPLFGDQMASVLKNAQSPPSGKSSAAAIPVSLRANPIVRASETDAMDGDNEMAVPDAETSLLSTAHRPELTGIRETTVTPLNEAAIVAPAVAPLTEPVPGTSQIIATLPQTIEGRDADEPSAAHGTRSGVDSPSVVPMTNVVASTTALSGEGVTSTSPEPALRESVIQQVVQAALARSQVVERFSGAAFELRLSPPELGPLRVELRRSEAGLSIRVAAATSETRALLDTVRGEITQSLQSMDGNGISFDVSAGSNFSGGDSSHDPMFDREPVEERSVSVRTWAGHSRDRPSGSGDSPLNVLA